MEAPLVAHASRTSHDLNRLGMVLADRIGASLNGRVGSGRNPETMELIRARFLSACQHGNIRLPADESEKLFNWVVDNILGLGPIEPFLHDEAITEVMVNGPNHVYVEKAGRLIEMPVSFANDEHVLSTVNRIISPLGRVVSATSPTVDARLPDGSRVNAVVAPCALDGTILTIRKFSKHRLTIQDLVVGGTLTEMMADYLKACVVSGLNIVVSGGTGSGKTTLLNVLSSFIPDNERIITIEDAAELRLNQRHVVRLESVQSAQGADNEVTIRELVKNSLRMRPDRIVIGECRGGEALDMLQAMNTGHDGSLTTIHANSPRDAISRLEVLVLMAGMDIPLAVVRRQIASAINVIVQLSRLRDGTRKVIQIAEVGGMEGDIIVMQDMFRFEDQGEQAGKVVGTYQTGGLRSTYDERLKAHGFNLAPAMFTKTAGTQNGNKARFG